MQYNHHIIQGWRNYYAAFYQTAMLHTYQHIDRALERWAKRKYKTFCMSAFLLHPYRTQLRLSL